MSWVLAICCVGAVAGVFYLFRRYLIAMAKEDLAFPLASCDTSMYDELQSDVKQVELEAGVLPVVEVESS